MNPGNVDSLPSIPSGVSSAPASDCVEENLPEDLSDPLCVHDICLEVRLQVTVVLQPAEVPIHMP